MTFTTLTFLFFLAITFALYWSLRNRRAQNVLLVIASYFFYGWWDWRFCGLMLAASLLDYAIGLGIDRSENPRQRKILLAIGLTGNLAMLGFFKYFNFFAENFQAMAASIGWHVSPPVVRVLLPVGISFYTFQTMSYSIDIYRRKMPATKQIVEYLAYVSFFPQLVAGPIERATNLLPQFFRLRTFDHDRAVDGCRQALWGFFKKMLIADNLAPVVDKIFSQPSAYTGGELCVATVFFAFQIYCDFSAYSDIASGVARLFGFELMRNFATPYFSQSLGEFWRRWHISLTTWFKDYVYVPLGGNRVSPRRRAVNVMITFLLSGIWHGASWNFVAWGAFNGLAVLPETIRGRRTTLHVNDAAGGEGLLPNRKALVRIIFTFAIVCIGWVFFRANKLSDAWLILSRMVSEALYLEGYFLGWEHVQDQPLGSYLVLALVIMIIFEWTQRSRPHPLHFSHWPQPVRWATYLGLSVVLVLFGTYSSTRFIYFQF